MPVDMNRPYICRGGQEPGTAPIYMYKDVPGVYMKKSGEVVSDEVAAEVRFPVKTHALERRKKELTDKRLAEIEESFEKEKAEIEAGVDAEVDEQLEEQLSQLPDEGGPAEPRPVAEPEVVAAGSGDGEPADAVRRTSSGQPRETQFRLMTFDPHSKWTVTDKTTGTVLRTDLDREEAETLLLEE